MKKKNTYIITLSALAIALNVIAGTVVGSLKIPFLFLDAVGTIFIAAIYGPYWGLSVGILTNLVLGVTSSYTSIPFAIVNGVIGLIVGFIARKNGFNISAAIISGIVIGIVSPIIGTVIAVFVFGGLTGGIQDVAVLWLKQSGTSLFTAAFLPRLIENLIDKVLSSLLVYYVLKQIPVSLLGISTKNRGERHAA
ncbi:energy-coupling factor transport system substrate-specific component [Seinonella peptonophila]|uniref:Energy-coupling factor transport system substrate-specific component n=1 Tax=Seinonella peptonophila TaxID=112248 RepID=A0A1M5BA04_9BACL|nr:CD3073 family putative ECF transporter S component [Seinonella peptonophila]SHF39319.1 energy-coupling factor transport system substrate-specific component [Seinonella peptonophila]